MLYIYLFGGQGHQVEQKQPTTQKVLLKALQLTVLQNLQQGIMVNSNITNILNIILKVIITS